jgi:hypothetical protein
MPPYFVRVHSGDPGPDGRDNLVVRGRPCHFNGREGFVSYTGLKPFQKLAWFTLWCHEGESAAFIGRAPIEGADEANGLGEYRLTVTFSLAPHSQGQPE